MSWEASNAALAVLATASISALVDTFQRENCELVGTIRSDFRIGGRI